MGTTGIKDTHTASLYELAFTATRSVSGQCCKVKQRRARLVAGWVTQVLEQGRLVSCAHAGTISIKEGRDQESMQSCTTPDPGYKWEGDNVTIRHHK